MGMLTMMLALLAGLNQGLHGVAKARNHVELKRRRHGCRRGNRWRIGHLFVPAALLSTQVPNLCRIFA